MKEVRIMMGMTISLEIVDNKEPQMIKKMFSEVFNYFNHIDETFSTYKEESEISRINRREHRQKYYSPEMKAIFALAEKTREETAGYFDIRKEDGKYDPSGIVKGWAIYNAAEMIRKEGYINYYVDAGGDIQVNGKNKDNLPWTVGIKNPFNVKEIVKVVQLTHEGIATSGSYIRGDHIYNPHDRTKKIDEILSFTVIGPNIYEADRFATAAFAMGKNGITFIEQRKGLEGYMIDAKGEATMTTGFLNYTQ